MPFDWPVELECPSCGQMAWEEYEEEDA